MHVGIKIVTGLLLLAMSAQAKPYELSVKATGPEINEYIDRVVNEIKNLIIINGLDPMDLPNLVRDFEYTDIFGITWTGNMSLTNGYVEGLLTILRDGDVELSYGEFLLHVGGRFNLGMLRMVYDFEASIMDIGPVGQAVCTLNDVKFDFKYDMNLATLQSNVTELNIVLDGRTHCEIREVNFIYDFLIETFINIFLNIFEDTIATTVANTIRELLQQALDQIGGFTTLPPMLAYTVPYIQNLP